MAMIKIARAACSALVRRGWWTRQSTLTPWGHPVNPDVEGAAVIAVEWETRVLITLSTGSALGIEGPFTVTSADGTSSAIDPERPDLDPGLRGLLVGRVVARVEVRPDTGTLQLTFADDGRLRVPPDADYESWTLWHAEGSMSIGLPGGEVALFRSVPDDPR
ncbi:DUF6188 family protein [Nocardioides montaniterrae]